ncbi:DUF6438 domain-containing protein [Sediminibacterium sp.]|uniref:DUF6438 domain-containing protein n=1 Tax=Sediminibacterium sp. TaxID=1917865 RepID=UPI00273351AA|nr:DUF6438 domain-containing protein [Sediminibacterium sp.]MDP3393071.1 DUF6438 domain-containing protein [Sediminibacterium sp.]
MTLLACVDKKNEAIKRQDQFKTISFATGGCYGKCPFLAIQIDSSLTYKFYGGRYTEKQGFFTAKVTQGFWDSLNIKMEQAKFKQLDTLYNASVDDMSIESYFTYGQIRKPLYGQEMDLPDNIRSVFYWLMDSYKKLQLTKVDTLLFETKIQFGQGPIPPPKIIKFTPPEIVE